MESVDDSSNVAAIGYEPSTRELHVTFRSGKTYTYYDVPQATVDSLKASDSIGRYLAGNISGVYQARKN
jgi:hypothetical protein